MYTLAKLLAVKRIRLAGRFRGCCAQATCCYRSPTPNPLWSSFFFLFSFFLHVPIPTLTCVRAFQRRCAHDWTTGKARESTVQQMGMEAICKSSKKRRIKIKPLGEKRRSCRQSIHVFKIQQAKQGAWLQAWRLPPAACGRRLVRGRNKLPVWTLQTVWFEVYCSVSFCYDCLCSPFLWCARCPSQP